MTFPSFSKNVVALWRRVEREECIASGSLQSMCCDSVC